MNDDEFLNDRDCTPSAAMQVPLVEQLRSVPMDARHIVCDTSKDFAESRNIPYGRMCHEAADELARALRVVEAARKYKDADFLDDMPSHMDLLDTVKEWEAGR